MNLDDFQTDEEFRGLLPPHGDEEKSELERLLLADGRALEPLTIWQEQNILVDGYTRYEICTEHGLPYELRLKSFPSREAAIAWVRQNQIGRRNLTQQTKKVQLGKLARELEKLQGNASVKRRRNVVKDLSEKHSISERTIARGKEIAGWLESIAVPIRRRYENGDIKLSDKEVERLAGLPKSTQIELVLSVDDKRYPSVASAYETIVKGCAATKEKPRELAKRKERRRAQSGGASQAETDIIEESDPLTEDVEIKTPAGPETSLRGIDEAIEQAFMDLRKLIDRRADYVGKSPAHTSTVNILRHLHTKWQDFKKETDLRKGKYL